MDLEFDMLEPVYDKTELQRLRKALGRIVRRSQSGVITLIKKPKWVAVPCESMYHMSASDQKHLLQAVLDQDTQTLWAIALEPLDNFPAAFAVPINAAGIQAFNYHCAHFNFALLPENRSWIAIYTTDEYFIIAGLPGFVQAAAGGALDDLFARFRAFVVDPQLSTSLKRSLVALVELLQNEYPHITTGTAIRLAEKGP